MEFWSLEATANDLMQYCWLSAKMPKKTGNNLYKNQIIGATTSGWKVDITMHKPASKTESACARNSGMCMNLRHTHGIQACSRNSSTSELNTWNHRAAQHMDPETKRAMPGQTWECLDSKSRGRMLVESQVPAQSRLLPESNNMEKLDHVHQM
ncbi:hypothetical protein H6P81_003175 [Aristolochia fimbriata]|uniref:Uncharacterized protein n=1 Tax=Aristolochia fimbriata TaxID=158543 RepID=A0AAV7FF41_ARIFI|nr:hypothetical protein H6P81_003175 [Aristolochia fimbriata]